ncbi:hypothetical protein D9619_000246 [Psilocybe cf. subviscida]|uniref:Uncharacterized protein n=1 Tax=Psilocybe cf. subviscida TaxID=2480587 RepID=A0A8H5F3S8_9AGAR|nr:hypothetical protein D9619_000246 [Psilocybe cf. subviscida]
MVESQAALPLRHPTSLSAGHLSLSIQPTKMQFKAIIFAILAVSTSMAVALPAEVTTDEFYRRNGTLKCHKYNYQLVCDTTHHCVSNVVTHKPGTYAGNSFCEDHRSCWCE